MLSILGCAIVLVFGLTPNLSTEKAELPSKPERFVVIDQIYLVHFHAVHIRDTQSGKEYLGSYHGGMIEVEPTVVEKQK